MGERIRDFSVRHTILFCIAVEIAGLAALIIFGGIIVLALPEADYYVKEFLPSYGLTIEEQYYTREAGLKFAESSQLVFTKVLK